jgi:hypothetical protein
MPAAPEAVAAYLAECAGRLKAGSVQRRLNAIAEAHKAAKGVGGGYDYGDNWEVSGAGIWQSAVAPASTTEADVYLAAGNGPFACNSGGPNCKNSNTIYYWGESAMRFPEATDSNPMTPADFYAPYVQRYTANMNQGTPPLGDSPTPASYQTEELSRLDLDFGTSGVILIPHTTFFALTADKSGYAYVMPAAALGNFKQNDAGLTGGTVTTQVPFQLSRLPTSANSGVCPINNETTWTHTTTSPCDEVHQMAFWNDLLVVWPVNESPMIYKGTFTTTPTTTYTFPVNSTTGNGSPTFDPCTYYGSSKCTANNNFPPSNVNSPGSVQMAIAANGTTAATLWAIVPQSNSAGSNIWGSLYAYQLSTSTPQLTYKWDSYNSQNCSSPPATGWYTTAFTEPTLANGAAYVPTTCAIKNGNAYSDCVTAGGVSGAIESGIIVFSTCGT